MSGITFLGAGSFGTALSIILSKKGHNINIWARNKDIVDDINVKRENIKYIKDVIIPSNVKAFTDLKSAIGDSDVIVIATPSHVVRNISRDIKPFIKENTIIVSLAKGMERKTFKRLSQVIKEENPNNPVVVLSGPSHAEEIALDIPTTVVVTSEDMEYAKKIQNIFMTNNFRVYTNEDIIGVEIGGAVKNIIALAAGVCDGAGYGDNTKAALMTRGISEIVKIGIALGAKQETFYGLSGMGDLIVTCTSFHSRNRKAGILIGKGYSVDEACKEVGMIVEGIKACEIFYSLKEKFCVSMPITDIIYNVLFKGENLKDGVCKLMSRDGKNEVY